MSKHFSKILSVIITIILLVLVVIGLLSIQNNTEINNVILLIGDGMGFMSIEKTSQETGETLTLNSFDIKSKSQTASANNSVTDSAAGATALACAVRTNNGCVGVYPDDIYAEKSYPMNLSEFAISKGMLTGVITTDSTIGATPACFSSHTYSRENQADITNKQLQSGIMLIWGTSTSVCQKTAVQKAGYEYITDYESMNSLTEGTRSFGQFTGELWRSDCGDMPTLAQMTTKAIDLLDDGENGFFLMVEGAHIDKNSHNNDGEGMKEALLSFDKAVQAALDYAKMDKHTLVVVTADHETGGITLQNGEYVYTTTGHTGVDVPLYIYGSTDFIKDGETSLLNTDIPKRIAAALDEDGFPKSIAS